MWKGSDSRPAQEHGQCRDILIKDGKGSVLCHLLYNSELLHNDLLLTQYMWEYVVLP